MTLDTRIYIVDPVDPMHVFEHANRLINAPADVRWSDRQGA